jgi:hypothetical protein
MLFGQVAEGPSAPGDASQRPATQMAGKNQIVYNYKNHGNIAN